MPPKIRDLIAELERAGFVNRGGKGNHRNFVHPNAQPGKVGLRHEAQQTVECYERLMLGFHLRSTQPYSTVVKDVIPIHIDGIGYSKKLEV